MKTINSACFSTMSWKTLFSMFFIVFFVASCQEPLTPREIVSSSLPTTQLWQIQFEESLSAQPLLANEIVVAQTTKALYGLDKASGQQLWRHPFSNRQPSSVPVISNGKFVVFGEKDGTVIALDTLTGEPKWQRQHCGKENYSIESIVSNQEKVFIASQPTIIEALDLENGTVFWHQCETNIFPSRGAKLFIGEEDKLYVVTTEVHVLNLESGIIEQTFEDNLAGTQQLVNERFYSKGRVWDANTMKLVSSLTSPSYMPLHGDCEIFNFPFVLEADRLLAAGNCGGVFALDIESYEIVQTYLSDLYIMGSISIYKDVLYALTSNGEIHALDPATGLSKGVLITNQNVGGSVILPYGIQSDREIIVVAFDDKMLFAFGE